MKKSLKAIKHKKKGHEMVHKVIKNALCTERLIARIIEWNMDDLYNYMYLNGKEEWKHGRLECATI